MPITDNLIYWLKAQSGQASPASEVNAAHVLSGGTITLVDRGGGDYVWRFSGGGPASASITSTVVDAASDTGGVTMALTIKVPTASSNAYQDFVAYTTTAGVNDNGLEIGQAGTAGYLRAQWQASGSALNSYGNIGATERTIVLRFDSSSTNGADTIRSWINTASRVGTAADFTGTGENSSGATLAKLLVDTSGSAVIDIKDWCIWSRRLTDAEAASVADNLRGTVTLGGGGTNVTPGAGALTITGYAPAVSQSGSQSVTPGAGAVTITGYAPTVAQAAAAGTITTPPLKNNTGTLLANETGVVANVYNASTGALVVRKTGLTSSAGGVVAITDAALSPGTTYAYEIVLAANGRRLPTAAAT